MRRWLPGVLICSATLLGACAVRTGSEAGTPSSPSATHQRGTAVELRGALVKFTDFPCHRSDPYVGNERIVFRGSDGSRTITITGNARWIGMPADPPMAALGQCRQVAPFEVKLPVADRYVIEVNDGLIGPITFAQMRAAAFRVRVLVGDHRPDR